MLMILPVRRAIMCGTTWRTIRYGPRILIAMTRSQSCVSHSLKFRGFNPEYNAALLTKTIDRLCNQILHRLLIADVEFHARNGVSPVAACDFLGKLTAIGNIGDHHARAFGSKRLRVMPADPFCAPGDDRCFSSKPRHDLKLRAALIVPALVADIRVLQDRHHKEVGGRYKPGQDWRGRLCQGLQRTAWRSGSRSKARR